MHPGTVPFWRTFMRHFFLVTWGVLGGKLVVFSFNKIVKESPLALRLGLINKIANHEPFLNFKCLSLAAPARGTRHGERQVCLVRREGDGNGGGLEACDGRRHHDGLERVELLAREDARAEVGRDGCEQRALRWTAGVDLG